MTDVIISSFISLFALFGKVEQVDEERAKEMLVSYLRHHFGIRNIDLYLDLYSDMRMAYEMTDDLNTQETVSSICASLHGKIRTSEEALLLLRLMEFCSDDGLQAVDMFHRLRQQQGVGTRHATQHQGFRRFYQDSARPFYGTLDIYISGQRHRTAQRRSCTCWHLSGMAAEQRIEKYTRTTRLLLIHHQFLYEGRKSHSRC